MTPRLNPFALPSETTVRFVLLVVAVLGTSLFTSNWLYHSVTDSSEYTDTVAACLEAEATVREATGDPLFANEVMRTCMAPTDHRMGRAVAGVTAGTFLLGGVIYLVWPALKRRRRRLRPLAPDVPEVAAAVAELSREAGLRRAPEVLWNPLQASGGALAFGLPRRPKVALGAGMVAACLRDRPSFDAVVRHELAHLRNGDVWKTYGSIAIWWALVLGGIVPLLVTLPSNGWDTTVDVGWRLAALIVLVYATRNAILRSREAYADVRASTWEGPGGALRRVLDALPRRPAGRLRELAGVHPDPAVRRRLVDAPDGLFRLDAGSAFAAGAAAGLAFPSLVNVIGLLTIDTGAYSDVRTFAAAIAAPGAASVLAIAAWRSTQASLARGERAPRTVVPALALALGLALGQVLSLDAVANPAGLAPDIDTVAAAVLSTVVLVAVMLLFMRWLVLGAEAWLPATRRSPSRILAVALAVASLVLAWGLGQLVAIGAFVQGVPFELLRSVSRSVVDLVVTKDVTFVVLVTLWAFPLAAWVVRGRRGGIGAWAFLDGGSGREVEVARPALLPALATAAVAGAAFLALIVVWRLVIRGTVPLSERDTDGYLLSFVYRQELIAVLLQSAVAVIVALRARASGALLGLLAAFVAGVLIVAAFMGVQHATGCVDALAIRPAPAECPANVEGSFMWLVLKDWVNEGALLALVAIPAALAARALVRRARRPGVARPDVAPT